MKIGILIDELASGGLQKTAIQECKELKRLGHKVKLLVLSRRNSRSFKGLAKGLEIEFLEDRLKPWQRASFKFPIFAYFSLFHLTYPLFLPSKIKKGEFDVLLAHGSFVCPTALSIKRKRRVPVLSFVWDPVGYILPKAYSGTALRFLFPVLVPLARLFDKLVVKRSDRVLASRPVGYADEVVPSAFDGPKNITAKNYKEGHFIAVTKWNAGKNPFFLLDIFKKVPNAKLVVAGVWEDKALLGGFLAEIGELGLSDRVSVTNRVTENRLHSLYRGAKAFIYPNFEAFGMGALEAAAFANPIIMPGGSGITHYLDQRTGVFPKEKDLTAFVKAVKDFDSNYKKCERLGREAFKQAQSLRWKNHTEKLEKVLEKVAQKTMLVFNLGFISSKAISGGDVLFMDLAKRLPPGLKVTVLMPRKGLKHWKQQVGKLDNVDYKVLKKNPFDRFDSPIAIFCTYIVRSLQALKPCGNKYDFYYSCSDVWPDIFPPFLLRFVSPKTGWVSRIYHIYLSARQRRGSFAVNFVSTNLQRISWLMMRLKSQKILALNAKLAKDLEGYGFSNLPVLEAGIDLVFSDVLADSRHPKGEISRHPSGVSSADKYDGVYLGRLSRTKGVYDLIDIWAQVAGELPKARLAIIGGGPKTLISELKTRAKDLDISQNISFLGFVPNKKDAYAIMEASKVFLFPSHEEGWGIVVAEAMANGLPVIGYDLDIFGAVYKKGFLTAPLFDTKAFAGQVLKILAEDDYRKLLSGEALGESRRFDNSKVAKEFAKILFEPADSAGGKLSGRVL